MKDGDSIPGLVGWETHGYLSTIYWADGLSEPPGHQRPYDYVPTGLTPASRSSRGICDRFVVSPRLADLA